MRDPRDIADAHPKPRGLNSAPAPVLTATRCTKCGLERVTNCHKAACPLLVHQASGSAVWPDGADRRYAVVDLAPTGSVNDRQPGGDHYRAEYQHWDFIEDNGIGYLEAAASKYLTRHRKKNGREDLEKSLHYTEKLIELYTAGKRQPRGRASWTSVRRFIDANGVPPAEAEAITLLVSWSCLAELEQAARRIRGLLLGAA